MIKKHRVRLEGCMMTLIDSRWQIFDGNRHRYDSWSRNEIILIRTRPTDSAFFSIFFNESSFTPAQHFRRSRAPVTECCNTHARSFSCGSLPPLHKVSYTFLNPAILLDNLSSICSTIIRWCKSCVLFES